MDKKLFSEIDSLGFDFANDLNIFEDKVQSRLQSIKEETKAQEEELSSMLYDREVICPICENIFNARTVKVAASKMETTDSDFFMRYLSINPYFYDVYLCIDCGYASMKRDFGIIKKNQIELVKEKISINWNGKIYPQIYDIDIAIQRYKLALLNCVITNASSSKKASNCLKIAWMYRLKEDNENEVAFLEEALKGFSDAFYSEDYPIRGMDKHTVMYLIGEINRRTGNSNDALLWFSHVVTTPNVAANLKEMARSQSDIIKDARNKSIISKAPKFENCNPKKGFLSRFFK